MSPNVLRALVCTKSRNRENKWCGGAIMDSRESVGVRNPVTRRDCDGYVEDHHVPGRLLSARTTRGLSMVHSLFLGLMQSHPAPAQKSDPKKEPSNGLPISPTICLPLYTATIGIGLAGNCVDVEVPIEAPDDSKDRFSFVSPRSPSPRGAGCTVWIL